MSDSILQEAEKIVHGDRGEAYGHPYDNFKQTAALWSAILGVPISIKQVGLCMIAVKISRECHAPKRDNLVDIAGYAETISLALAKADEPRATTFPQVSNPWPAEVIDNLRKRGLVA